MILSATLVRKLPIAFLTIIFLAAPSGHVVAGGEDESWRSMCPELPATQCGELIDFSLLVYNAIRSRDAETLGELTSDGSLSDSHQALLFNHDPNAAFITGEERHKSVWDVFSYAFPFRTGIRIEALSAKESFRVHYYFENDDADLGLELPISEVQKNRWFIDYVSMDVAYRDGELVITNPFESQQ